MGRDLLAVADVSHQEDFRPRYLPFQLAFPVRFEEVYVSRRGSLGLTRIEAGIGLQIGSDQWEDVAQVNVWTKNKTTFL